MVQTYCRESGIKPRTILEMDASIKSNFDLCKGGYTEKVGWESCCFLYRSWILKPEILSSDLNCRLKWDKTTKIITKAISFQKILTYED